MKSLIHAAAATMLVLVLGAWAIGAEPYGRARPVAEMARDYTRQIVRVTGREAIEKAWEYEADLLARYPQPTYEMGLFQCGAEHISFHSPFVDWKREDLTADPNLQKLAATGWSMLLVLKGSTDQETLVVCCVNGKRLEQHMGLQGGGPDLHSDRGMQMISLMFASNFGAVESQEFRSLADRRVFWVRFKSAMTEPEKRMILLGEDNRVYAFLLVSPPGDIAADEARLEQIVKTSSFDYQPEDADAIQTARADCDRDDPRSILTCVERLAGAGEFNAAAEDLAALRQLLHKRMPKVTIQGDTATFPAYGITLKNPDPKRWKLSSMEQGAFQGAVLEDRFSVNQEGILVAVIDLLLSYGPETLKLFSGGEVEKGTLIGMGRGCAASLGQIERERLLPLKGSMAYEAVAAPAMPGVKARVQCIKKYDYGLLILMLGDAREFDAKTAECDRIVNDCLQVGAAQDASAEAPARPWQRMAFPPPSR